MQKTNSTSKSIKWLIIFIVAVYIGYQLYAGLFNPLTTETATYYEGYDGYTLDGTVVRTEDLIQSDTSLVQYYVINDGEKVAKNGVISELYSGSEQIAVSNEIKEIEQKKANLEAIMAYNNTEAVDLKLLSSKVYGSVSRFVISFADDNYSNANDCTAELLSAISIRQAARHETTDFSATLASLNDKLTLLNAKKEPAQDAIRAKSSGYFVSQADGYESVLTPQAVLDMKPDTYKSIKPEAVKQNVIGKIVSDYKWYIVSPISIDESARFSVGKKVSLKTNIRELSEFNATVAAINKASSGNDALLVLECSDMNGYVSSTRNITVTVVTESFDGLMVNRKALRVKGDKLGVYVVSGMEAEFVEVEVIKYTEGYAVCKVQTDNNKALRLYDKVIVKGKNLYDGKVVS